MLEGLLSSEFVHRDMEKKRAEDHLSYLKKHMGACLCAAVLKSKTEVLYVYQQFL